MNAYEARKLTAKAMKNEEISPYIAYIDRRIKQAASEGRSSVLNPNIGNADQGFSFYMDGETKKVVRLYYENLEYEWVEHAEPDPGHPCSCSYTTLEW